jgi:hypothetical protein
MREGIALLVLAALCSAPLVLLVVAVGEPPRNYLAQIGILIALGAAGWFWAAEVATLRVLPRLTGTRLPDGFGLPRPVLVVGFLAVFIASSAFVTRHAFAFRESASGDARAAAVRATTDWIKANVAAGTPIGFGSFLGHEMSIELRGRNPMVQTGQQLVVADASAPLGLAAFGGPPVDDFIAVDNAPRRSLEFYAYRASTFSRIHQRRGTRIYVHNTGTTTSVPSLLAALRPEHGFTELAAWSFGIVGRDGTTQSAIESHVFAVDPDAIDFSGRPVEFTPDALRRLVELLEADPRDASTAARNLLDRAEVVGDGAEVAGLRARLEALAAG